MLVRPVHAGEEGVAVATPSPKAAPRPAASPAPTPLPALQFYGYLQVQGNDGSLGSLRRTPPRPATTGVGFYPTDTRLIIRRLRPHLDWNMAPNLHLRSEGNYDSVSNRISLKELSLRWEPTAWMTLTAGETTTRWGYEGQRNNWALEVLERTDVTAAMFPGRDVGVDVELRHGSLRCNLGVYNGERLKVTTLKPRACMARLTWKASRDWTVGASGAYGVQENGTSAPLPVRRFGLELHYVRGPWIIEGEYEWSHGFNYVARISTVANGWYVRATRRINPCLDVVLNYDTLDPDMGHVTRRGTGSTVNARNRILGGVNLFLDRTRMHRVALDYEIHRMTEGTPRKRQGWRAQYQVRW